MKHSCPPSHGWPDLEARRGLNFKSGSEFLLLHRTGHFNFWIETLFCDLNAHRPLFFFFSSERPEKSEGLPEFPSRARGRTHSTSFKGSQKTKPSFWVTLAPSHTGTK